MEQERDKKLSRKITLLMWTAFGYRAIPMTQLPAEWKYRRVTGTNEVRLGMWRVSADITGTSGGTAYGYGGIAGINNKTISYCSYQARTDSNDTTVSGISVAGTNVNLGGIAGINGNKNTSARD